MEIGDRFVLHANGGALLCTAKVIPNFDQVVKKWASESRRLVPSAFYLEGQPVALAAGADALCGVKLNSLTLNTKFAVQGESLVPVFNGHGLRMTLEWPVPSGMELWFASCCSLNRYSVYVMGECFLFARKTGMPGFWGLPLSNLYPDGRVCMGDAVAGTIRGDTVQDCFKAALESFRATYWNGELLERTDRVRSLFRWTPERTPVPPPADWERHCLRVSRQEMEDLCP